MRRVGSFIWSRSYQQEGRTCSSAETMSGALTDATLPVVISRTCV
jgi:hypothetical protein